MAGNIRSLWTELRAPTHPHVEAVTPNAGFPGGSVSEPSCQCRRCRFNSWVEKIPWIRKCQPTSVFLPGKSPRQKSLAGYSPWGHKRVWHNWATKQQHIPLQILWDLLVSFQLCANPHAGTISQLHLSSFCKPSATCPKASLWPLLWGLLKVQTHTCATQKNRGVKLKGRGFNALWEKPLIKKRWEP